MTFKKRGWVPNGAKMSRNSYHGRGVKIFLDDFSGRPTETCRVVAPTSTEEMIQRAHAADVVEGETKKAVTEPPPVPVDEFGVGVFEP